MLILLIFSKRILWNRKRTVKKAACLSKKWRQLSLFGKSLGRAIAPDQSTAPGIDALIGLSALIQYLILVRAIHTKPSNLNEFIFVAIVFNVRGIFLAVFAIGPYLVFVKLFGLFLRRDALLFGYNFLLFLAGRKPGLQQRLF